MRSRKVTTVIGIIRTTDQVTRKGRPLNARQKIFTSLLIIRLARYIVWIIHPGLKPGATDVKSLRDSEDEDMK